MSRYGRVWVVFRKELIETLRDRRTLIAMVLVPLVLYPVLMVVLMQALASEKGRQERRHYTLVVPDEAHKAWIEGVLRRDEREREARDQALKQAAEATGEELSADRQALRTILKPEQISIEVADALELWALVERGAYDAALVVHPPPEPDNFADNVNRVAQILYSDTDPLSEVLYRQLNYVLGNETERIIRERVIELAGSDEPLSPIWASNVSVTSPDRQFAKVLAIIVPFLLVTMTVTGAMYPAIDLTAGERERGTLETLAVSPVPVGQIVAGKFGVIVTIAMVTTTLNLASMTAVIHFSKLDALLAANRPVPAAEEIAVGKMISQRANEGPGSEAQALNLMRRLTLEKAAEQKVGFITSAAPIVLLSMVPFAVLFGAIMLAVCSFARTFKEAQNYMMPVMMAAIVPAMVLSYMPTVKLEGPLLVVPVANIVVLMRELFLGNFDDVAAIAICLLSTTLYAAAAVAVANRVYGNESVLFSDVGTYKTLILRRFMKPQPRPTAAFALTLASIIFPLYFFAQSGMISPSAGGRRNLEVIAATQIILFAVLPLLAAWYIKLNLRETFSLELPRPLPAAGSVLIAASILPVSQLLQQIQFYWLPPGDALDDLARQQTALFEGVPVFLLLLALALAPALCEEVLFRGFLLSGLRGRMSDAQTAVCVGLIFGLFHFYAIKIPVTAAMGIVLALVCLRTGSIFAAMLVHLAQNGLALLAGLGAEPGSSGWPRKLAWLYGEAMAAPIGTIVFNARTAVFLGLFAAGLGLLFAGRSPRAQAGAALT